MRTGESLRSLRTPTELNQFTLLKIIKCAAVNDLFFHKDPAVTLTKTHATLIWVVTEGLGTLALSFSGDADPCFWGGGGWL